jgi:hypothetical protein
LSFHFDLQFADKETAGVSETVTELEKEFTQNEKATSN